MQHVPAAPPAPSAPGAPRPHWRVPLAWVRLTRWEYWPWWAVYLPVLLCYPFWALRARSLTFFSNVNPAIPGGGLAGESKRGILQLLPPQLLPATCFVLPGTRFEELAAAVAAAGIGYPLIAKPDVGERGRLVARIDNAAQLASYHAGMGEPYLVQQYVDLPVEAGVLYVRMPGERRGQVTSIVLKDLLAATGDGRRTLAELVAESPRARMQQARLLHQFAAHWHRILPLGETLLLEPIGNHCRGTRFRSGQHLLADAVHRAYDRLFDQIPDVHYARLDVRAASLDDLQAARVVILELNGVASEPAHIYDPDMPLWRGWASLLRHWHTIARIGRQQRRAGHPYLTLRAGLRIVRDWHRAHAPAQTPTPARSAAPAPAGHLGEHPADPPA